MSLLRVLQNLNVVSLEVVRVALLQLEEELFGRLSDYLSRVPKPNDDRFDKGLQLGRAHFNDPLLEGKERRYDQHRVLPGPLVGAVKPHLDEVADYELKLLGELDEGTDALVGRLSYGSLL